MSMKRNQLAQNTMKLCNLEHLKFTRDNDYFYISTAYETFCFELDDQDVWLSRRELRGGGPDDIKKINKFLINPGPRKILNALADYTSIHNDEEYMRRFYQKIKEQCTKNGVRCEIKFDKIFFYTMAEEFYFKFVVDRELNGDFELMHRGYNNGWDKFSGEYHKQQKKFSTPYEVVGYIANHTRWKYGV